MIRRSTKLQLVAFALITLIGVSYVSARYVGLGERLFGDGYVVTADFTESGGIFTNAEVTYRGVAVGRVDRLRLANDGVHVDLRLDGGSQIPADTRAVVENRSAVGEQYVDLQPRRAGGPYLADGSHITVATRPRRCTPRHCCSTSTGSSSPWTSATSLWSSTSSARRSRAAAGTCKRSSTRVTP